MFLTSKEISELTGVTKQRLQSAALKKIGVTHKIRPDGSPLILRAHVEQLLGVIAVPTNLPPENPALFAIAQRPFERPTKHAIQQPHGNAFLRIPSVIALVGLSRTSIYQQIKAGTFPAPIRIGNRSVAWSQDAILAWQSNLARAAGERN